MDSTISSVSVVTIQDSFYWSAHAVINGRLTTASCMHNHSREDLADKCLPELQQRWDVIAETAHEIRELANLCEPIYEVRWLDNRGIGKFSAIEMWTRFCLV